MKLLINTDNVCRYILYPNENENFITKKAIAHVSIKIMVDVNHVKFNFTSRFLSLVFFIFITTKELHNKRKYNMFSCNINLPTKEKNFFDHFSHLAFNSLFYFA